MVFGVEAGSITLKYCVSLFGTRYQTIWLQSPKSLHHSKFLPVLYSEDVFIFFFSFELNQLLCHSTG